MPFFNCEIERTTINVLIRNAIQDQGYSLVQSERITGLGFAVAAYSGASLSLDEFVTSLNTQMFMRLLRTLGSSQTRRKSYSTALFWFLYKNYYGTKFDEYTGIEDNYNELFLFSSTGARGTLLQLRQIMLYRGLMMSANRKIIRTFIRSCLSRGLTISDLLISAFGARKGVVDTAVRTADAGYLTRRLIFAAQDLVMYEYDCGTTEGLTLSSLFSYTLMTSYDELYYQHARGRVLTTPAEITQDIISFGTELTDNILEKFSYDELSKLNVRSVWACNAVKGICSKCYGWNLGQSSLVDIGDAIGIIAAQSIGEPGTQLTLRTFHTGGVVKKVKTQRYEQDALGSVSTKISHVVKPWLMDNANDDILQRMKVLNIKITSISMFTSFLKGSLVNPGFTNFIQKTPTIKSNYLHPTTENFTAIYTLLERRKSNKNNNTMILKANNMIYPPIPGLIKLCSNIKQYDTLIDDIPITIFSTRKVRYSGYLPFGSILLINNNSQVSTRNGLVSNTKPMLSPSYLLDINGYLRVFNSGLSANISNPKVFNGLISSIYWGTYC